jgi:hypothetical protein
MGQTTLPKDTDVHTSIFDSREEVKERRVLELLLTADLQACSLIPDNDGEY